jgi:hypothetical protein
MLKYRVCGSDSMEVERDSNGGFPEPVAGEPVRLVRARHDACGTSTRVRVPPALPARAVRRVVCESCRQPFECEGVDDGGVVDATSGGIGRAWKYLSIPVAAAAVIVALILIQGSGGQDQQSASAPAPPADKAAAGGGAATAAGGAAASSGSSQGAELVRGSSYTLALPHGWARTEAQGGATFAASAQGGGGADATLWVQRDPSLSFPQFEAQSLAQLKQVAGSARVTDRTAAPTADDTIVTLAPDPRPGAPTYEVTLRVAGPYRYYLATTVEPNASRDAVDGAELIHSSFVPVAPTGKSG